MEALANSHLATIEQRVARVLSAYPESRDSDTSLTIRYWTAFQAEVLERYSTPDLGFLFELDRIGSIVRSRQHIQNELELFQATPYSKKRRGDFQHELHEFLASRRDIESEIRFYLDETGTDPQGRYRGVGGICLLDYRQYQMHHEALRSWRGRQGWVETIHFTDLDQRTMPRAISLLEQLQRRRAGILFVGYIFPIRSPSHADLAALYTQLISDSIGHLRKNGCLPSPKSVTVFKEAEEGFDRMHLDAFRLDLESQLAREHENLVFVRGVQPLQKGMDVLLECADLIASGMQRRALYGGRNPKDRLAEAVMNVTGFENRSDNAALFKLFPPT